MGDAKARSGTPCPFCPCLPGLSLPVAVQNLMAKTGYF